MQKLVNFLWNLNPLPRPPERNPVHIGSYIKSFSIFFCSTMSLPHPTKGTKPCAVFDTPCTFRARHGRLSPVKRNNLPTESTSSHRGMEAPIIFKTNAKRSIVPNLETITKYGLPTKWGHHTRFSPFGRVGAVRCVLLSGLFMFQITPTET